MKNLKLGITQLQANGFLPSSASSATSSLGLNGILNEPQGQRHLTGSYRHGGMGNAGGPGMGAGQLASSQPIHVGWNSASGHG